jgi:hypothetical protein
MATKIPEPGIPKTVTQASTYPLYIIPSAFGGEAPSNVMRVLQSHFDRVDRHDYGECNAILRLDNKQSGAAIEFQATPETIRTDLSELEDELYEAGYYLQTADVERGGDRPYRGPGLIVRAAPGKRLPVGLMLCDGGCKRLIRAGLAYGVEEAFSSPSEYPDATSWWFCKQCAESIAVCPRCGKATARRPEPSGTESRKYGLFTIVRENGTWRVLHRCK